MIRLDVDLSVDPAFVLEVDIGTTGINFLQGKLKFYKNNNTTLMDKAKEWKNEPWNMYIKKEIMYGNAMRFRNFLNRKNKNKCTVYISMKPSQPLFPQ